MGSQVPFIKEITYQPARLGLRWVHNAEEIPYFDWTQDILNPYFYLSADSSTREIKAQKKLWESRKTKNLEHLEFPRLVRASPHFDFENEEPSGKMVSDSKFGPIFEIGLLAKHKSLLKAFNSLWLSEDRTNTSNFMQAVHKFAKNYGILNPQPLKIHHSHSQEDSKSLGKLERQDSLNGWLEAVCEVRFWQLVLRRTVYYTTYALSHALWGEEFWNGIRKQFERKVSWLEFEESDFEKNEDWLKFEENQLESIMNQFDYKESDNFTQCLIDRLILDTMQAINSISPKLQNTKNKKHAEAQIKRGKRVAPGLEIAAIAENYLLHTFFTNSSERLLYQDKNLIAPVGVLDWALYELAVLFMSHEELRPCSRVGCQMLFLPQDDRFGYCSLECREKAKYSRRHKKEMAAKRASKTTS
jgi:hypothetical protein